MNPKGQALIEVAVFFLALSILLAALCSFTKWMAVRMKLMLAAKQGALIYSSGHVTKAEAEYRMRKFLLESKPALSAQGISVSVHPMEGFLNRFTELDESVAEYTRRSPWHSLLRLNPKISEKCVIKHAPHYWAPYQPGVGPAVPYAHEN